MRLSTWQVRLILLTRVCLPFFGMTLCKIAEINFFYFFTINSAGHELQIVKVWTKSGRPIFFDDCSKIAHFPLPIGRHLVHLSTCNRHQIMCPHVAHNFCIQREPQKACLHLNGSNLPKGDFSKVTPHFKNITFP